MKKSFIKNLIIVVFLAFLTFNLAGCINIDTGESGKVNNNISKKIVEYEQINIADMQTAIVTAIEKAEQSVIAITHEDGGVILRTSSMGSGVVVKVEEGHDTNRYYAVTNRHVVLTQSGAVSSNIKVTTSTNVKYNGRVLKVQEAEDLALVVFDALEVIPVASIADSNTIKKGNIVLAIGSPYSLDYYGTATMGIVSHNNRLLEESKYVKNGSSYQKSSAKVQNMYIQHDAAINSGNSGGGLFDINGRLIGINTAKLVDSDSTIEGIAFSIPSSVVKTSFSDYIV